MADWNIPLLEIGGMEVKLIQGAMGVGVSGASLASAIANEGGWGIIAAVGLNASKGYAGSYEESSSRALEDEIKLARSKMTAGRGFLGVNIMHVLTNYSALVETALQANIDAIISGAGIPRDLPSYAKRLGNTHTKLIPIISSARLADMICRSWARQDHLPDAIVVEGPEAGGHLGYSREELADADFVEHGLERIIPEVVEAIKPYEKEKIIPVIAAGGIFYGGDIRKFLDFGASGVQMATRFVITNECDADIRFKQAYIDCKKEDITIILSPVGMPGRAINNKFLEEVATGKRHPFYCPFHCIKSCNPKDSPYCIAKALIEARTGNFNNGYVFVGANAWRCKEEGIIPVKRVFEKLNQEYLEGKVSD